jgi:carnitine-CoA ligase
MRLSQSRKTIHQMLDDAIERQPDAIAVSVVGGKKYTRTEIKRLAIGVAGALQAENVVKGDRVAMLIGNSIEFVTTWFGTVLTGAVPVPLNTAFVGEILANVLRSCSPKIIVIEDELLAGVVPTLRALEFGGRVIVVGDGASAQSEFDAGFDAWSTKHTSAVITDSTPADICTILYSSGTTGPSKGAIWPHHACYELANAFAVNGKFRAGDMVYTQCPLFHGLGLFMGLIAPFIAAEGCVLTKRFSVSRFWKEIIEYNASKAMLISQMTTLLWQLPPSPLDRAHKVDAVFMSPRPASFFDAFEERYGLRIYGGLGSTDVGQAIRVPVGGGNPFAVGREAPDWEVKLVDEFDQEVTIGEVGEYVARPRLPYLGSQGYWGMPEATNALMRNCWYHSGDLLRRDKDGWFYFVDRKKDTIRRGGENISSFEVERALREHPAVVDAAAFAVPHNGPGDEDVMACLLLREQVSLEEIGSFVEARLPYYAVPRYYDVRSEFPLTPTQKVAKFKLKQMGITTTTWDRGRTKRSQSASADGKQQ